MIQNKTEIGMTPPHPGIFIAEEVLEPLSLSVTKAAQILDVRRATLSDLIHGKAALSPEMALRIEIAFSIDMKQMLQMQAWYDTATMRKEAKRRPFKVQPYHSPEPA